MIKSVAAVKKSNNTKLHSSANINSKSTPQLVPEPSLKEHQLTVLPSGHLDLCHQEKTRLGSAGKDWSWDHQWQSVDYFLMLYLAEIITRVPSNISY